MDLSSRLSGGNGISRLVQGGVDTYSYSANGGSNSNYTPEPEGIRDPVGLSKLQFRDHRLIHSNRTSLIGIDIQL